MMEQPTHDEKLAALANPEGSPWTFSCRPPDTCSGMWDREAWIVWIGEQWYRKAAA